MFHQETSLHFGVERAFALLARLPFNHKCNKLLNEQIFYFKTRQSLRSCMMNFSTVVMFFSHPVADLSQPAPQSQSQTQGNGSDPAQPRRRLDLCMLTFSERLEQYYRTRVCLSTSEVSRAQERALDIATEIQAFLHTKHPDMPLGEMTLAGSLLDDLQVVKADHACLLVPLQVAGISLIVSKATVHEL